MYPKYKWKGVKFKSKRYLDRMGKKYPGKILHHLWKLKCIDFFVIPVELEEHNLIHHKINGGEDVAQEKYNRNYLWDLINILIEFLLENFEEWRD